MFSAIYRNIKKNTTGEIFLAATAGKIQVCRKPEINRILSVTNRCMNIIALLLSENLSENKLSRVSFNKSVLNFSGEKFQKRIDKKHFV